MSDAHFTAPKFSYALGIVIVASLGTMTIASAQSPFASKNKKQAWELPAAPQQAPAPAPQTAPAYSTPSYSAPSNGFPPLREQAQPSNAYAATAPTSSSPSSAPRVYGKPVYGEATVPTTSSPYQYQTPSSSAPVTYGKPSYSAPSNSQPSYAEPNYAAPSPYAAIPSAYEAPVQLPSRSASQPYSSGQQGVPYGQAAPTSYGQQSYPTPYSPNAGSESYPPRGDYGQKRSWVDKLGLRNLSTTIRGFIKGGAGAVNRDNGTDSEWSEDFVADGQVEFEVAAITDSGYEYGINLEARAQYDRYRRGFGGRLPDCPPTEAGCSFANVAGVPTALRGHTSRFYTSGEDDAEDTEYGLESAHLFLRSAYGDVTIGRDDGAAYLFSLGAPSLLIVGASNSPVDYTGLDSVKTVNDASGFAEKVTYTSPRLLGDMIGVGVQVGASYAINARACGVDYCVKEIDETGTLSPDPKDIFEVGLALDRTFSNGLKMEATATYAHGSEDSLIDGLDDLRAFNVGAEVSMMDITLGGSFLKSNNGLADGDYEAWDVGATWKPSALGFTVGYGRAIDENVQLKSNQYVAGITYDFKKFTIGAGAQYIERETQAFDGASVAAQTEDATALFIEGGFKF